MYIHTYVHRDAEDGEEDKEDEEEECHKEEGRRVV
jgi:hypothetical protein